MQLTILGTSAMVPTKTRNHSAIFLSFGPEGLLFDCGEATQRQIKQAGIKITKITRIFISHWHGDHVLGLPGLLMSLSSEDYQKTLHIYGAKGLKKNFSDMDKVFPREDKLTIELHEIEDKNGSIIIDKDTFKIETKLLEHRVLTYGYKFTEKDRRRIKINKTKKLGIPEGPLLGKIQKGNDITFKGKLIKAEDLSYIVKGKNITYVADTRICDNAIKLAKDSDILVCESTYALQESEKAREYYHMTSTDAANVAESSNSKRLVLTHISQRYKDTTELLRQAKDIFPNTELGFDLMKIKL